MIVKRFQLQSLKICINCSIISHSELLSKEFSHLSLVPQQKIPRGTETRKRKVTDAELKNCTQRGIPHSTVQKIQTSYNCCSTSKTETEITKNLRQIAELKKDKIYRHEIYRKTQNFERKH